jgi:hypothetical protein
MKKITTESITESHHKVLFGDKLIGYFIMDVDGYYYFDYVTVQNGLWTSYSLRMVADILEEMNRPYDDIIKSSYEEYCGTKGVGSGFNPTSNRD